MTVTHNKALDDLFDAALGVQTLSIEATQALAEVGFKNWELGQAITLQMVGAMLACSGVEMSPQVRKETGGR